MDSLRTSPFARLAISLLKFQKVALLSAGAADKLKKGLNLKHKSIK